jgi:hypothetical protein
VLQVWCFGRSLPSVAMNAILWQLYAMRAQLDAMIALVSGDVPGVEDSGACQHPEDQRQNTTKISDARPSFFCKACQQTIEGIAP